MSQLHSTKNRIKSIDSTRKITKAMELVASVKLKRWQRNFENILDYSNTVEKIISSCVGATSDEDSNIPQLKKYDKANKKLVVIITSSLGLCGGYNYNVLKFADSIIEEEDKLILLGNKGEIKFAEYPNELDLSKEDILEHLDFSKIKLLANLLDTEYKKGIYKSVILVYTSYKNSLKFEPTTYPLFPLQIEKKENIGFDPIYEPNKKEFLALLIPKYLETVLYTKIVESIVSEQASRRNAMDNATENADELVEKLTLQYNKARQAAITNELIDVVAGARNS